MHSGSRWTFRVVSVALLGAAASLWTAGARADEPIKATEPSLMSEPGEVTDVVDAFDTEQNDPFDLWLSLGFVQSWESAKVKRESQINPDGTNDGGSSGFTHNIENVAEYKHTWSTLNMRADIGIFHDLGFYVRVPLVLADDRSLDDLDGSAAGVNKTDGTSRVADPATGQPMFNLPFKSPTRSGIDYIAAGLRWAIFNQHRDPTKPTWTIEIEGRFGVGEPMHPCNANPGQVDPKAYAAIGQPAPASLPNQPQCPSSLNNVNSVTDGTSWYRDPRDTGNSGGAGISRGTNAIKFGTMISERYRYVEPYGGFWMMAEFQKRGTEMGDFSGINGVITNHPPIQGGLIGGIMVHPWENLENYQRFSIDLRFKATYVSQGRDYTPLFDALGTSNAPNLLAPNPGSYGVGPDGTTSVGKFSSNGGKNIYFTGVTDVEAHGIFGGSMAFIVQAAKLIRFSAGFGFQYIQAYLASSADACNPNATASVSAGEQGACKSTSSTGTGTSISSTGTPNPNHRDVIDLPGRRFRVTEDFIWDAWVTGTVMF